MDTETIFKTVERVVASGVLKGVTDATSKSVVAAYESLKNFLSRFGHSGKAAEALKAVEENPESSPARDRLARELSALDILSNPEFLTIVTTLVTMAGRLPGKNEGNITVSGTDNIVAGHGGMAIRNISIDKVEMPVILPEPQMRALHSLPPPPRRFIEQKELKECEDAVRTARHTIVAIDGMPGVGKTSLALKVAHKLESDYPDAQFYIDLRGQGTDPLTPLMAMFRVIRQCDPKAELPDLGSSHRLTPRQIDNRLQIEASYRSALYGRRAILMLDNAKDSEQLEALIPPESCLTIITSRHRLARHGFAIHLNQMPIEAARDLLQTIAPRLRDENEADIVALAHLCGCLPVALVAVAGALNEKPTIDPVDYVQRLRNTQERLRLTASDTAFQASHELLPSDLQTRFSRLSVFPESFDHAAANVVWCTTPKISQESLATLVSFNLVNYGNGRYWLHDLVQLFAANTLKTVDQALAQRRHAEHFLSVTDDVCARLQQHGDQKEVVISKLNKDASNIRAGHVWAKQEMDRDEEAREWCWRYVHFDSELMWLWLGSRECINWRETGLVVARRQQNRERERAALSSLGWAYKAVGEYRIAIRRFEELRVVARETSHRESEGEALFGLALVNQSLGEYFVSKEQLEQRLQISMELKDDLGEAAALGGLGGAYLGLGKIHEALDFQKQRLTIIRESGKVDPIGEGYALCGMGECYLALHEYPPARACHEEHREIARSCGDVVGEHTAWGNLGDAYHALGDYAEALRHHEKRIEMATKLADRLGRALGLFGKSRDLDGMGDRKAAIEIAKESLQILEMIESAEAQKVRAQLRSWGQL